MLFAITGGVAPGAGRFTPVASYQRFAYLCAALLMLSGLFHAGVFLVVAWLELYGTAIGTWEWAPIIPGTGVPQGNPPSGVASGYVWFDIVALAVAPALIRLAGRIRTGSAALPDSA